MRRLLLLVVLAFALPAHAVVEISWVPVGDAGNPADTETNCLGADCGSVAYDYFISKYETTNAQYAEFLNAVAATDTYGLYNPSMATDAIGGIVQSGSSGSYSYSVKSGQGNNPVAFVSWYDAVRFTNWLHNGQPTGVQGAGTTETGAYTFAGATTVGGRNVGALTFLPTENEWYKAAHYDATSAIFFDYPTGSNTAPSSDAPPGGSNSANFYDGTFALTGMAGFDYAFDYLTDVGAYESSSSPYGTFDQFGNVWEWNETAFEFGSRRGFRGGSFDTREEDLAFRLSSAPAYERNNNGFRVAYIPTGWVSECSDGLDNDGDGFTDFPQDPGCADANDPDEHSTRACDDGVDNDGDRLADFPNDWGCASADDVDEHIPSQAVYIQWVRVGDPGNPADTVTNCYSPNCGSVPYGYYISKYEITNAQYAKFLNAVAKWDTSPGLYFFQMGNAAVGGIMRSGDYPPFSYAVKSGREDNPVVFVSYYDAVRFVNWLHNGQPTGPPSPATTEDGAYTFNGATSVGPRNAGARMVIPTESEWYKAAYYDAESATYFEYPTGSDVEPLSEMPPGGPNSGNFRSPSGAYAVTGEPIFYSDFNFLTNVGAYETARSPNGTFDQGGNVAEWTETGSGTVRVRRGGEWDQDVRFTAASNPSLDLPGSGYAGTTYEDTVQGFRIATLMPPPACSDGVDNDGDGLVDYHDDPGCADESDVSERMECDDGLDNDGDGLSDLDDPGCPFPEARPENPTCDDGLDNDRDGFVDFDDPQCESNLPYWETRPCGLGVELVLLLPLIALAASRRRRAN